MKPASDATNKTTQKSISIAKRFVDRVTEPGLYLDDKIPGFRLKVTAAGAKVYLMYGKVKGQPTPVKITIGHHGDKMPDGTDLTAEKARAEADIIRGELRSGINRNERRREEARVRDEKAKAEATERQTKQLTLGKAFDELLEKNQLESTRKGYRSNIKHLKDWLDKPLITISKEAICERYAKVKRKSPSAAAGVMRMLRAIFATAQIKHGDAITELAKPNPVQILNHTQKGWDTPVARHTYLADASLPLFYEAVLKVTNDVARDYLLVALLTGLRRDEINTLRWVENIDPHVINLSRGFVDVSKRIIIIDRAKNKQRHVLWMPDYLHELFLRRSESPLRDSRWAFPGNTRAGHFDDPTYTISKICRETGIRPVDETGHEVDDPFTSHDLRRTFGTAADTLGYSLHEVKRLLNHKGSSVTERHYIQAQAERTKEPMQRINDRLLQLMQGQPGVEASNVVPITKASS